MNDIFEDIRKERERQDKKWGVQNHPLLLWFSIIGEEYGELCQAYNRHTCDKDNSDYLENIKKEATQIAASCAAMLECLARGEVNDERN